MEVFSVGELIVMQESSHGHVAVESFCNPNDLM